MRRIYIALTAAALMSLVAAPAAATKPDRGCGAEASGWHTVTFTQWLATTEAAIGEELPATDRQQILAGLEAFDEAGNDDGLVCMKDFQPSGNTPAYPAGFFNLKDNTAAVGS